MAPFLRSLQSTQHTSRGVGAADLAPGEGIFGSVGARGVRYGPGGLACGVPGLGGHVGRSGNPVDLTGAGGGGDGGGASLAHPYLPTYPGPPRLYGPSRAAVTRVPGCSPSKCGSMRQAQ